MEEISENLEYYLQATSYKECTLLEAFHQVTNFQMVK